MLGILIMNIWAFAGPQAFFDYPLAIADRAGAPVAPWAVIHTLFEGSQRTLLSLLFGVGAALSLARLERSAPPGDARRIYYRRTFALIAFGLVNAYVFMWPADILFVSALAGLCLYPLRRLRTRTLLTIAVAALAVPLLLRALDLGELRQLESAYVEALAAEERGETLSEAEERAIDDAIDDWERELKKARPGADDERIAAGIRAMQSGTLAEIAVRQAKVSLILQTIVAANWWFLDALAMMIIGMVLCRTGIFTGSAPRGRYLAMIAAGFAVGLPLALWQTQTLLAADFHPLQEKIVKLGYDLRRFSMAIGYLGLVLLFCGSAGGQAVKRGLAAVGRMALTNYLAQSILCALIFSASGSASTGASPATSSTSWWRRSGAVEIAWASGGWPASASAPRMAVAVAHLPACAGLARRAGGRRGADGKSGLTAGDPATTTSRNTAPPRRASPRPARRRVRYPPASPRACARRRPGGRAAA